MDPLEFLKNCIKIYSPSGREEEYSQFLANFLKKHHFKVHFDKIGNLIAEKGSGSPILLLSSHMDTIPGKLPIREAEGKLYGRGTVDCKSSLAAMVYSLSKYKFDENKKGKIIFAGIVQEESSLLGINEFINSNVSPEFAIFGEPTKINQLCIGYKGRLCIKYSISTKTGHVANSWSYINAIEVALEIWNSIKESCKKLTDKYCIKNNTTKYFNQIIPNLTVISGGNLTNCVPSNTIIQVDIRFPPLIKSQRLIENLDERINNLTQKYKTRKDTKLSIQKEITSQVEGFEIKGHDIITSALRWAIYNTINEKPKLIKKTGTTFINMIGSHFKIPSITFGPGDPKLEHTDIEHIKIEEYLNSIKIYKKFFSKFFELHQRKYKN